MSDEERVPTPEQRVILAAKDRIRLVKAAPGSGKTWLLAEALRLELRDWKESAGGIAALSFTNVARDEIHLALGFSPPHPHTVRTIDSFLFRFVVRPFLSKFRPTWPSPRLVPADQASSAARYAEQNLLMRLSMKSPGVPIFQFDFVGSEEDNPMFSYHPPKAKLRKTLSREESALVFERKKEVWEKTGRLSHSDVAYISAGILDPKRKASLDIRILLSRRFPLLIVDELQDTGFFRSQALMHLLSIPTTRAILVGDPDQAIYEFTGATPESFDEFGKLAGTALHGMDVSVRCPQTVCDVGMELTNPRRALYAESDANVGRAFLVPHDGTPDQLIEWVRCLMPSDDDAVVKVLVRKNRTRDACVGGAAKGTPKYNSRPVEHLDIAVRSLRRGETSKALFLSSAALSKVLFGSELVSERDLAALDVSEFEWRKQCIAVLLNAERAADDCSCWDWGCHCIAMMVEELQESGWWSRATKPAVPKKPWKETESSSWPERIPAAVPESSERPVVVQTVHVSKGETHDVTAYFVPRIAKNGKECPSDDWWSADPKLHEERRIAYVAATRSRGWFILCIPEDCMARLKVKRKTFVDQFEVLGGVSELPSSLSPATPNLQTQ